MPLLLKPESNGVWHKRNWQKKSVSAIKPFPNGNAATAFRISVILKHYVILWISKWMSFYPGNAWRIRAIPKKRRKILWLLSKKIKATKKAVCYSCSLELFLHLPPFSACFSAEKEETWLPYGIILTLLPYWFWYYYALPLSYFRKEEPGRTF